MVQRAVLLIVKGTQEEELCMPSPYCPCCKGLGDPVLWKPPAPFLLNSPEHPSISHLQIVQSRCVLDIRR